MGCLARDLSMFNFPIEEDQWTLAASFHACGSDVLKKLQSSI